MPYKIGDRFRVVNNYPGNEYYEGKEGIIIGRTGNDGYPYLVKIGERDIPHTWRDAGDMELISNNKNSMNLIDKVKVAMKGEPEKTFIQKGVTNIDGSLTSDGRALLEMYLLDKNKDDFKTTVVDLIPDEDTK